MKNEAVLLKDMDLIDGRFCLLKEFRPIGGCSFVNGEISADPFPFPYAVIDFFIKDKNFEKEKTCSIYIEHKLDFINLWNFIKERGIDKSREEVVFWYTRKKYKNLIISFFSSGMPKFIIAIVPKGTFDTVNQSYDLQEDLFVNLFGLIPINYIVPNVMNKKGYPNK